MPRILACLLLISLPAVASAQSAANPPLPPHAIARFGDYRFYHGDRLGCYAINHDGRRVATGDCGVGGEFDKVVVWDGTTGEEVQRWRIPGGGISCLDISPDGKRVAIGCCVTREQPNDVFVYDADSGKLLHRLSEFKSGVNWVQFTLDGQRLHVSEGNGRWFSEPSVTSWDAATGRLIKKWKPPEIPPRETEKHYTQWTPQDGRLSVDEKIVFWRFEVEVQTPKGSVDMAKRFIVLRAYATDCGKQLMELETEDWPPKRAGNEKRASRAEVASFLDRRPRIKSLWVSPDGKMLVSRGSDGAMSEWNLTDANGPTNAKHVSTLKEDDLRAWLPYTRFRLMPDGKLLNVNDLSTMASAAVNLPDLKTYIGRSFSLSPDGRTLALDGAASNSIALLETITGRPRRALSGHRAKVGALAFSPDSKLLVSGGNDNVIYVWDVVGARHKVRGNDEESATCWTALARTDAMRAGEAIGALIRQRDRSVAFLKEQLHPVVTVDETRLKQLLADLDADSFEKRETASKNLALLGETIEASLRKALKDGPPAEAKRRVEELLEKLDGHSLSPETLQSLRAIEVLEHIGTPEARQLLATLAKGAPEARITRDAKSSLERLQNR